MRWTGYEPDENAMAWARRRAGEVVAKWDNAARDARHQTDAKEWFRRARLLEQALLSGAHAPFNNRGTNESRQAATTQDTAGGKQTAPAQDRTQAHRTP